MDGDAPNVKLRKGADWTSTLLWVTDETPADISGHADRADRQISVGPPPMGSVLRIVDFPPVTRGLANIDQQALVKDMGVHHPVDSGGNSRHPYMHRTRSVDYAIILEGEIDMLLDDSEVHLKTGDVVIQQGTNHAWVNQSDRNCRMAFVLIDAKEPLPQKGKTP